MIWILGRAAGRELDLALRGRELWRRIGERAPQIHFRASGALVVAQDAAELALLEAFVREGRAAARAGRVLDADETRHVEPALGGQLLEASLLGPVPTRSVLDSGGLRYYPAFDLPERASLPAPNQIADEFAAQLLVTPRVSGCVTLGDTHVDNAPDAFALDERTYAYLIQRYESVFGQRLGPIRRRWMGQYLRLVDGSAT